MNFVYMIIGVVFGVVLTKSEVISWFRINDMFLFNEPHMYLIIGSAIAVGAVSILILKHLSSLSTITRELEPYLIRNGYMARTGKGRMLLKDGNDYIKEIEKKEREEKLKESLDNVEEQLNNEE